MQAFTVKQLRTLLQARAIRAARAERELAMRPGLAFTATELTWFRGPSKGGF